MLRMEPPSCGRFSLFSWKLQYSEEKRRWRRACGDIPYACIIRRAQTRPHFQSLSLYLKALLQCEENCSVQKMFSKWNFKFKTNSSTLSVSRWVLNYQLVSLLQNVLMYITLSLVCELLIFNGCVCLCLCFPIAFFCSFQSLLVVITKYDGEA